MKDWHDILYSPELDMFGGWKPDSTLIYSTDGVTWTEGRELAPAEIDLFRKDPSLMWAEIERAK